MQKKEVEKEVKQSNENSLSIQKSNQSKNSSSTLNNKNNYCFFTWIFSIIFIILIIVFFINNTSSQIININNDNKNPIKITNAEHLDKNKNFIIPKNPKKIPNAS